MIRVIEIVMGMIVRIIIYILINVEIMMDMHHTLLIKHVAHANQNLKQIIVISLIMHLNYVILNHLNVLLVIMILIKIQIVKMLKQITKIQLI